MNDITLQYFDLNVENIIAMSQDNFALKVSIMDLIQESYKCGILAGETKAYQQFSEILKMQEIR